MNGAAPAIVCPAPLTEVPVLPLLASLALAGPPGIDHPLRTGEVRPGDAAVVIGLERYPFLPDVRFAWRDADAVHTLFVHTLGIPNDRVAVLKSGNREQIARAVRRAAEQVDGDGRLWVYFAGHGASSPTGEPLLVADDARQDIEAFTARSVPITELTRDLGVSTTVVIDACWTGRSRDGEDLVPGSRFVVPVWSLVPDARIDVWTGASVDQVSGPYEPAQHGLFTYFWVGAARGWADGALDGQRDGIVTSGEIEAYLRRAFGAVQAHTQTPRLLGTVDAEIARGRRLERAPDLASLPRIAGAPPPPSIAVAPAPARPPGPFEAPLRHRGGGLYADASGRAVPYAAMQKHYGDLAALKRVDANLRGARNARWAGVGLMATGAMVSTVGALVHVAAVDSYNFDRRSYESDRAWCEQDPFFCGSVSPAPTPPRLYGLGVGAAIASGGGALVVSGALYQRGQRARAARIVNRELGR